MKWELLGLFLSLLFFIALLFAAITSAISILEPAVMYLVERKKIFQELKTTYGFFFFYLLEYFVLLSNTNVLG